MPDACEEHAWEILALRTALVEIARCGRLDYDKMRRIAEVALGNEVKP